MNDVTRILSTIEKGEARPEELLPIVYEELRHMASAKMAGEGAGHTLQATALVHEAWMRLADSNEIGWENRAQFLRTSTAATLRTLLLSRVID